MLLAQSQKLLQTLVLPQGAFGGADIGILRRQLLFYGADFFSRL